METACFREAAAPDADQMIGVRTWRPPPHGRCGLAGFAAPAGSISRWSRWGRSAGLSSPIGLIHKGKRRTLDGSHPCLANDRPQCKMPSSISPVVHWSVAICVGPNGTMTIPECFSQDYFSTKIVRNKILKLAGITIGCIFRIMQPRIVRVIEFTRRNTPGCRRCYRLKWHLRSGGPHAQTIIPCRNARLEPLLWPDSFGQRTTERWPRHLLCIRTQQDRPSALLPG